MDNYLTLTKIGFRHEIVVEKSRFIASVARADNVAQAQAVVQAAVKAYPDATHHCYALLTADGQKYSDAGEPSGTAGLPLFNALRQQGLFNVVVVVTRYFGGVKLGTGGLARAYGRAATVALTQAPKVRLQPGTLLTVTVPYAQSATLARVAAAFGQIQNKQYQGWVTYQIAVPRDAVAAFTQQLAEALHGQPTLTVQGDTVIELPVQAIST